MIGILDRITTGTSRPVSLLLVDITKDIIYADDIISLIHIIYVVNMLRVVLFDSFCSEIIKIIQLHFPNKNFLQQILAVKSRNVCRTLYCRSVSAEASWLLFVVSDFKLVRTWFLLFSKAQKCGGGVPAITAHAQLTTYRRYFTMLLAHSTLYQHSNTSISLHYYA